MTTPNRRIRQINLETWISAEYERLEYRLQALIGRRALIISLMSLALGLTSVDMGALGTMASVLEQALNINNASFGLVSTASWLIGAVAALPIGIMVDRFKRIPLLASLVLLWALGMAFSAIIHGYTGFLLAQILVGISGISLGAVVASLTGDYFPPSQRGRIFGLIVSGEMLGAGIGMLLTNLAMDILSWRAAFWVIAFMGALLSWIILRLLKEPDRGSMTAISQESVNDEKMTSPHKVQRVSFLIESRNIPPHSHRVIKNDPTHWGWFSAARYILSIPTNLILLIGSTASYFYFNGLLTFAVLYLMERYGLDAGKASLILLSTGSGSIVGILFSGWLGDWLLRKRIIAARVWVAASAFFVAVVGFIPAFLLPELLPASIFFFLAAAGLGATNPTLNAARLDIMHSRLWGRAESLRNALRYVPVALSPYLFGLVSDILEPNSHALLHQSATGLGMTFQLMLILLLFSGIAMLFAALTYPRDVATAIASEQAIIINKPK